MVELVRRHLTEQGEPRSAAEVATALETAYAERDIKTAVVRTTLENLVAKNQAQRTKQGSSVYYTAPAPAERTAAAISDEAQAE
ncbi:BlaI/MecI/CopY family transcriptional regulator [Streptomyces sp. NPDC004096]|uniref:BlaI/MecI/CopY family transcriptional regulator n=1 Tax=Streptomyces sp. NPDC057746 TaxID=3346237 RepID=UPI00368073E9